MRHSSFNASRAPTSRAVAVALVLVLAWGMPTRARADEGEAERLFREGRASMLDGRTDEGCAKLTESQRLEPRTGTLLNVAACREEQGRLVAALEAYRAVLVEARAAGQTDRVHLAEQRIAVLDARVAKIEVHAPSAPVALETCIDDIVVELGSLVPVDPGRHVITARSEGKPIFARELTVAEGEQRAVAIVLSPPPPPRAKPPGRWILEIAAFGGVLAGHFEQVQPKDPRTVAYLAPDDCCAFPHLPDRNRTTVVAGVNLLARYRIVESFSAGLRFLGGATSFGAVVVLGPSLAIKPWSWLELGVWGGLGRATYEGKEAYVVPSGTTLGPGSPNNPSVVADTSPYAIGLEATWILAKLGADASVAVNVTPVILGDETRFRGSRSLTVPVGLVLRFQ